MEEPILQDRQRKILRFLNGNKGYMTGQALSNRLGVSTRTVRSDIAEINQSLDPCVAQITADRGKGYLLEVHDRKTFHTYISGNINLLTREDRIQYLLLRLLSSDAPLALDQLEDEMYISRSTLESDIRAMQSHWIAEHLQLLRRRETLFLVQDEPVIRTTILRLYSENIDFNSRSGIVSAGGTLNLERLSVLRSDLRDILDRQGVTLDDFSFFYFALAAWICTFRQGKLPAVSDAGEALRPELEAIRTLFAEKYDLPLPPEELHWLQGIFRSLSRETSAPVDAVLAQCLDAAMKTFPAPFLSDSHFQAALRAFLCDCSNSMAFPRFDSRNLLLELEFSYPELAQLSRYLTEQLLAALALPAAAVDPLCLLPSLITAKFRYLAFHPDLQPVALFSCHLPENLSDYLFHRLKQHFHGRIRFQGPYPVYERRYFEKSDCDFLISTVDMANVRHLAYPVVTISPHLTPADFAAISRMAYDIMLKKAAP